MNDDADMAGIVGLFGRFNAEQALKEKDEDYRKAQERFLLALLPVADALQDLDAYLAGREREPRKAPLLPFSKAPIRRRRALMQPFPNRAAVAGQASDMRRRANVVLRMLLRALRTQGVEPMSCAGAPFDLSRHCSVGVRAADGIADDTVVEELERGYVWNDTVLRQASVIVSQGS